MGIVVIAFGALALGFVIILLLSFANRAHDQVSGEQGGPETPHAWLTRLDARDLGNLLSQLFAELKFEVEDSRYAEGFVDLFAVNPTPITGGRVYIRGVAHPPLGMVGEEEVRNALDTARAEMAGKALVATGGSFSPEARAAAVGAPLEFIDGAALLALVKKHLPPIAVAQRV